LLVAVHPQRLDKRMRNTQCPSALGGLRCFEDELPIDALERLRHTERSGVQVNITPA
jgi:hypothetical protein